METAMETQRGSWRVVRLEIDSDGLVKGANDGDSEGMLLGLPSGLADGMVLGKLLGPAFRRCRGLAARALTRLTAQTPRR
jgi:hypothetical protein